MASLGSMLLYWYHFSNNGRRIEVETDDDSIAAHSYIYFMAKNHVKSGFKRCIHHLFCMLSMSSTHLHLRHAWLQVQVLTCTRQLQAVLVHCGPKHGGANEVAFVIQQRYDNPDEAEADIRKRVENKEVVIGFGHPVYTVSDPRNEVIKKVAHDLAEAQENTKMYLIAERLEAVMKEVKTCSRTSTGSVR